MAIISLIITLILSAISIKKFPNSPLNPITFFCLLWTGILFLSNLNLYQIYKPSNEAYLLITLMVCFFFLGSVLYELHIKKDIRIKNDSLKIISFDDHTFHRKLLYFLYFIAIFFFIVDLIIMLENLFKGIPMWQIRNWSLEPFGSLNPILSRRGFIEEMIRTMIIGPFLLISPPISAYYFMSPNKLKHRYIILLLSIVTLALSSFTGGGGRLGIIYYYGSFILSYFALSNKYPIKFKKEGYKKGFFISSAVVIIILVAYTSIRTSNSFIKQVYTYFALPPTLLSEWLPKLHQSPKTFGLVTFFGLHSYIFRIFGVLNLGFLIPNIYNISYQYILNAEKFINTGFGIGNAFVSPIYYFYLDGGLLFVCIFSLFFGVLVNKVYTSFIKNINFKSFILYSILFYGVFITFARIQTSIPSYFLSIMLVYVLFSDKFSLFKKIISKIYSNHIHRKE